jgi:ketosteroid isomerase-like protein
MRLGAARGGALCSGEPGLRHSNDMKLLWPCWLATLVGLLPMASGSTDVEDVRTADAAFAARAAEIGHHAAFIEYLADDAVLFRPGAVRGQEWLATHEPAGGRLEWSPAAAAPGCTAALAVTTGPWRYSNSEGGEPVAGHYLSLWRLDEQARWRVVLDHGVDHAGSVPAEQLQAAFARFWPAAREGKCTGRGDPDGLAEAERRLNEQIARRGLQPALQRTAAEGALLYRDDVPPGPLAGLRPDADVAFGPGTLARTVGTVFEPGTDLAVTHGVLQSPDGVGRSLFVRVWRRDGRRWQVAIDMRTPLPEP